MDAAHELHSPLSSLLTTLQVAETYPQDADWPETVGTAAQQAHRIQALAEDMLLLAPPASRICMTTCPPRTSHCPPTRSPHSPPWLRSRKPCLPRAAEPIEKRQ